jgi:hypothetical protein
MTGMGAFAEFSLLPLELDPHAAKAKTSIDVADAGSTQRRRTAISILL